MWCQIAHFSERVRDARHVLQFSCLLSEQLKVYGFAIPSLSCEALPRCPLCHQAHTPSPCSIRRFIRLC